MVAPPLFKVKRRKAASDPPALKLHRSEVPIGEEGPEMSCNGRKKRARERKWGVSEGGFLRVDLAAYKVSPNK